MPASSRDGKGVCCIESCWWRSAGQEAKGDAQLLRSLAGFEKEVFLFNGSIVAVQYSRCTSKWKCKLLSHFLLFVTPWTTQSMEFSRQEHWVGTLSLLQGIFPTQDLTQVSCVAGEGNSIPFHCHKGSPSILEWVALSLLQQIFPTQELNWRLLHCRWILYQLSYQGSPRCPIKTFSYTHIHMCVLPQIIFHYRLLYWIYFPMLYGRSLLFIYFIYNSSDGGLVTQLCPTLCGPVDCSPLGSSVHGKNPGVGCHSLLQGSSQLRDQTQVSCSASGFCLYRKILYPWATREAPYVSVNSKFLI